MNKTHLAFGVLVAVLLVVGVALNRPSSEMATGDSSLAASLEATEDTIFNQTVPVTFTGTEFIPSVVVVTRGDSVLFVNASGNSLRIAPMEDPKDASSAYIGFAAQRSIKRGESFGVSLTTPGIWGYKNLQDPSVVGIVVVR